VALAVAVTEKPPVLGSLYAETTMRLLVESLKSNILVTNKRADKRNRVGSRDVLWPQAGHTPQAGQREDRSLDTILVSVENS
jgi:hypothetical protein